MINIPKPFVVKTRPRTRIMRKILLLIFGLVSLANVTVNAQNNLRNGYIITNQNDTIYGQLDYRANNLNYHSCIFKKDNKIEKYLPEQIIGYGFVNNKYYSSGILKNAFVEVLVSGTINLYKFDGTYYVSKNGGTVFKLEHKQVKTYVNGAEFMREDSHWQGILSYLIADCLPDPLDQVRKMNLNEHELDNLIIRYNSCKRNNFKVYKKDKPWTRIQYGGAMGVTLSSVQAENKFGPYYYVADHYSSVDSDIGVVISLSFPKVTERLSLQAELYFSRTNYQALKVVQTVSSASYYDTYVHFNSFSIPVSLNLRIPWEKNAIYIQAGASYQHRMQTESRRDGEFLLNGIVTTYPESFAFTMDKNTLRMFGGFSYSRSFKHFDIRAGARYYPFNEIARDSGFLARSEQIDFTIVILKK